MFFVLGRNKDAVDYSLWNLKSLSVKMCIYMFCKQAYAVH